MIENTKKRKEFFIQIVLPLIIKENNIIKKDRRTLFDIINKSNNTTLELSWLEKKYKQYGVKSEDLSTLKIRMDVIPTSLAIAQAAKETGWGTSRFALEGNNLYGMREYDLTEPHIKPLKNLEANFGLKVYPTKCLSRHIEIFGNFLQCRTNARLFSQPL